MPFGLSVVRPGSPFANVVLCICNVRPHAKICWQFCLSFSHSPSLFICLVLCCRKAPFFFYVLRALRGSSADPSLIVEWEGLDALEPIQDATTEEPSEAAKTETKDTEKPATAEVESSEVEGKQQQQQQLPSPAELSESSDDGSGDEYVEQGNPREDTGGNRHQRKVRHRVPLCTTAPRAHGQLSQQRTNNRRIAAVSSDSEDGEKEKASTTGAHARRANVASTMAKMVSTSPQPTTLKRKQSISTTGVATASTTTKRKRAESSSTTASATEDAARKYCLGKFSEMFAGIFMHYPHVHPEGDANEEGAESNKATTVERKPEELTEEEKTQLQERASAFAAEVEQAVFETYAEPDKYGKPGAGIKYKYVSWLSAHSIVLMRTSIFFHAGSAFVHLPLICSNPIALHCTSEYPPDKSHPRRSQPCLQRSSRHRNNKSRSNKPNKRPSNIPF